MIQVKTFKEKFNWKKLEDISTSSQINEFIRNNPEIKIIDIKPWNSYTICITYETLEKKND